DPVDDFYAVSLASVRYDEQLLGVPYVADVVHVVYAAAELDEAPPTWNALLSAAPIYLFPGSAVEGQINLHTAAQYLGAGGELSKANASPDLDAAEAYYDFLSIG